MPQASEAKECCIGFEPEPVATKSRDCLDILLNDHRKMECMFRAMRNRQADRAGILQQFANLLVAHSMTEEETVYPAIQALANKELQPGWDSEHTEGYIALLTLMEERDSLSSQWDNKLSVLFNGIMTHMDDEEQHGHNLGRQKMPLTERERLGDEFLHLRDARMNENVGRLENVRKLVHERASIMQMVKGKAEQVMQALA